MNFLRFSLPEGFTDLYVETDLPDGSLIELAKGFAITSDIPPGNFNLIFNFNSINQLDISICSNLNL